jgi:hypothetical protein
MKKLKFLLIVFILLQAITTQAQTFTLKSKDAGGQATNRQKFNGMGCNGENISPELYWENAPNDAKSFAVSIYDPDAPTGSGWWHWLIFDIPAGVNELKSDAGNISKNIAPAGCIQSITDFGKPGYGGPCPPTGDKPHMYIITVYALKTARLGLDKNANAATVGYYLNSQAIEKATIVMYSKH